MRPIVRFAALPVGGSSAKVLPPSGQTSAAPAPAPGSLAAARRTRGIPEDLQALREHVCRACPHLQDDHCGHPGCPTCFRHPTLRGPWKNLRRCPGGWWSQLPESKTKAD